MVCSQIRHVSILDASSWFKKLQIRHHICHIESGHGNIFFELFISAFLIHRVLNISFQNFNRKIQITMFSNG